LNNALALWKLLDKPGHDACRLDQDDQWWQLSGTSAFLHDRRPALLSYSLICNSEWQSQRGAVSGWIGDQWVAWEIERLAAGSWTLDGVVVLGLEHCIDLDYNFTPATNLTQLRRVGLQIGESADVPVAWLQIDTGTLSVLPQRYERRSETSYWYEAPSVDYSGLLEIDASGFARHYPDLAILES
jgi:uncharacterized protein